MGREIHFPRWVVVTLALVAAGAAYPLLAWGTPEICWGVVAGALLSTANVVVGYWTIERSFHRSHTAFMKAVIGGMGLRMAGMIAAMLLCLTVLKLHTIAFTVSLLALYVIFLVLEILYLQNKVSTQHVTMSGND
jgi:hypothetical protein